MRILQAHSRHAARGGADAVMDTEGELLRGAGHEVLQYVADAAGASQRSAVGQGVDAVWNRKVYRDIRATIRSARPDVLHVHTPFPGLSPAVFRAAHAEGVPAVSTLHSFRYSCIAGTLRRDGHLCEDCVGSATKLSGLIHGCYHGRPASAAMTLSLVAHHRSGTFSHHVSRFIALTEFAKSILVRDGIPPARVVVKANSVDDPGEPQDYGGREPVALFVGRLVPEKGVMTLLDAWRRAEHHGSRLHIVGDGPLANEVRSAAGADGSIEFLGWQEPAAVAAIQARARTTVICSEWYEGQPLVLLDAFAHGTPVIVSDLDNLSRSVLDHGAGRAFRTGDAESLAATISRMLGDPEAARTMSRAARALYLRDHTHDRTVAALETIYADVISEVAR